MRGGRCLSLGHQLIDFGAIVVKGFEDRGPILGCEYQGAFVGGAVEVDGD